MDLRRNLFWFLKKSAKLKLNNPAERDAYVQQVLSRGKTDDVRNLLKTLKPLQFRESFLRLSHFLPSDVRKFWEDFFGNTLSAAKRNP